MKGLAFKRVVAAAVFCFVLGALVVLVTASAALRKRAPDLAVAVWPWNAEARGLLAGRRLVEGRNTDASQLARRAVREAPGDAVSLRVLGLSEEIAGAAPRGARLMQLATDASRRDLLTNLWFIEHHVARNDIAGAVRYYDYSLKSSASSEQILFPILVPAMADPVIAQAVRDKLVSRPVWMKSFLQYAFASGAADDQLVKIVVGLAKDKAGLPLDLKAQYVQRLAERGDFANLSYLARGLGRPMIDGPGALDEVGPLPPVDWRLLSGPGLSTFPEAKSGFSFVLAGQNAVVAERLLRLPSGSYAFLLNSDFGSAAPANIRWVLTCAQDNRSLVTATMVDRVRVEVPPRGCVYQKLSLAIEDDRLVEGAEVAGVLSGMRIDRVSERVRPM